jgi:hypothetical protein
LAVSPAGVAVADDLRIFRIWASPRLIGQTVAKLNLEGKRIAPVEIDEFGDQVGDRHAANEIMRYITMDLMAERVDILLIGYDCLLDV